jgi:hypothetical protein
MQQRLCQVEQNAEQAVELLFWNRSWLGRELSVAEFVPIQKHRILRCRRELTQQTDEEAWSAETDP